MKKKLRLHVESLRILQAGPASKVVLGVEFSPTDYGASCFICYPEPQTW